MEKMGQITTEMMEYICDNICIHAQTISRREKEEICSECKLGSYLTRIFAEHEKYSGIVLCQECEYRKDDNVYSSTDFSWCRKDDALDGCLKETDGCSRGIKGAI